MSPHNIITIRVAVIGKSGTGKSATCNNLLGKTIFKESGLFSSATTKCQATTIRSSIPGGDGSGNLFLRVVDTPGLFDTKIKERDLLKEMEKFVVMCSPGPHVVLLIVRAGRFTEEEYETVKILEIHFGRSLFDFMICVFTHKKQYLRDNKHSQDRSDDEIVRTDMGSNKLLQKLLKKCHQRYVFVENGSTNVREVDSMTESIWRMYSENDRSFYTNEDLQEAAVRMSRDADGIRKNIRQQYAIQYERHTTDFDQSMLILRRQIQQLQDEDHERDLAIAEERMEKLRERMETMENEHDDDMKRLKKTCDQSMAEAAESARGITVKDVATKTWSFFKAAVSIIGEFFS